MPQGYRATIKSRLTGVTPFGGILRSAMSSGQYFDAEPAVASRVHEVTLALPGDPLVLSTDRGVFSSGRIDPGTLVLLRCTPNPATHGDLLDLGCGYGPIALSVARRSPAATVWALDVNQRALALTAANAQRHHCANIRPVAAAEIPPSVQFAEIWSNPPIHIGKAALHELLELWLPRLEPGGRAWLVVQRHLGADSLASWMRNDGWGVERRASKAGYRVLCVRHGDEGVAAKAGQ
jgi:16S rRNA (guanine1207-N2)-methyltransferase